MLNSDGTQSDSGPDLDRHARPRPYEQELARLMTALKGLRTRKDANSPGAITVFRVFPDLSEKDWEELAQKHKLENWVAVPFDLAPEDEYKACRTLLDCVFAREKIDPLTRLPNREQFRTRLNAEMQRATHTGTDLSVITIDINPSQHPKAHFTDVAWERVLVKIADIMRACSRMYDLCARLSLDEFALILPGTPPLRALAMAERLRDHVLAEFVEASAQTDCPLVFSAGIASLSQGPGITPEKLVEKAEEALYRAKEQGCDRILLSRDFSDYDTKVQSSEKLFLFFGDAESGDHSS